jgi:hypothetical protein
MADVGYAGKAEWADVMGRIFAQASELCSQAMPEQCLLCMGFRRCNQNFFEHAMTIKVLRHST